jgi:chromosome segregation ATPase
VATEDELNDLQRAFYSLYNKLTDAYWAASTVEAKDEIQGARDLIDQVLDMLDRADLENDNAAAQQLTVVLQASDKDLRDLQTKLDTIVHNVGVASTAIQAIGTALTAAGKLMAIV